MTVTVDVWRADCTMTGEEIRARAGVALSDHAHTNVSHTQGLTVLAVAMVRVGIDVEVVRPHPHLDRLARRTMTDEEYEVWSTADDPVRAFTQHWTRVEAYLKGIGTGLRGGVRTRPDATWAVLDVDVGEACCAALAVEACGAAVALHCHRL